MGEIKIKSGNLYPIQIGEDSFEDVVNGSHTNDNGELVVSMASNRDSGCRATISSTLINLLQNGHTYSWSVELKADTPMSVRLGFYSNYVSDVNITAEYIRYTFDSQVLSPNDIFIIYNRTGVTHTVYLRNFTLNEGSTALPYQPYFLNRPAHKYVNGEWIDIPTHKYTNNRWQGELTSQSPLKFRADGEMLDWRVEGKTSENLFDVKHFVDTAYCHNVVLTQLDNGMKIQATSSNDPYANYVNGVIGQTLPIDMRSAVIPCEPNTDYTLRCVQSSRLGKYISYFDKDYKVVKNYTPFSGTLLSFKTPETCVFILLRLGDSSTLSKGTTIELTNIQFLEGTYTTSTIPPYEPYGGVGDYDETEQKYKIPVRVEGENLVESVAVSADQTLYGISLFLEAELKPDTNYTFAFQLTEGYYVYWNEFIFTNTTPLVTGAGDTMLVVTKRTRSDLSKNKKNQYRDSKGWIIHNNMKTEDSPASYTNVRLYEGTYTADTLPPYEVNLYTDHQLMDGDSIDFATDQIVIPIATGNNVLTVDTAVKPKSVFVKFEG